MQFKAQLKLNREREREVEVEVKRGAMDVGDFSVFTYMSICARVWAPVHVCVCVCLHFYVCWVDFISKVQSLRAVVVFHSCRSVRMYVCVHKLHVHASIVACSGASLYRTTTYIYTRNVYISACLCVCVAKPKLLLQRVSAKYCWQLKQKAKLQIRQKQKQRCSSLRAASEIIARSPLSDFDFQQKSARER